MSRTIVIGLTGLAGAGKDTVADTLVTHAGFSKIAFADALRDEVLEAFERSDRALWTRRETKEEPTERLALGWCTNMEFVQAVNAAVFGGNMPLGELDEPRSPRQILQWWGTEYRRAQFDGYWVSLLSNRVRTLQGQGQPHIVVTDCRFANEAACVRALGGQIWQVFRPGLAAVEGGHASQTSGDALKPERFVVNNGTVPELAHQVLRQLVKAHGGVVLPLHWPTQAATTTEGRGHEA